MQQVLEFPVNPKYTFQNFVVCNGNKAAFHFTRQLAASNGTDNLLYLHGPQGSGKTHLLKALANSLVDGTDSPPTYLTFKNIDSIYQGAYPAEEVSNLGAFFADAPALIVDDLHLIPDNNVVRIEFWQLFNDFYGAGKTIALAGLNPPKELPNVDDHLVSRLLWGLIAKVDVSDDDSRRMIMQKLATDRHIKLPDDVVEYLITHTSRDIASLLRSFELICRQALSYKRKITVRLARETIEHQERLL